jgi:hypothetical protein
MIRGLGIGVGVILAVIAAGFIAQRLFGSHSDHWKSEAEGAIEALPYGVAIDEGSGGLLVGTIQGHLGVVVHFTVEQSGAAIGRSGSQGESETQREERHNIVVAIKEALCQKSIGQACFLSG